MTVNRYSSLRLKRYAIAAALVWTVFVGVFLFWDLTRHRSETADLALQQATMAFEKDLLARRWAAQHGGVYVPVTPATPPNPLPSHLPERDITTPSGKRLTLLNLAYVTRQLHELQSEFSGVRSHITSRNPINPGNAPDAWETGALKAFENGAPEFSEITAFDERSYLRLMRPLKTDAGCLTCHAAQGYKIGDIRGGISVAVPVDQFLASSREDDRRSVMIHGATWLVVLVMMVLVTRRLTSQDRARALAEQALQKANESLEHRIRERTVELESAIMMMQGEMDDRLGTERELEQSIVALSESERRLRDIMGNMPLVAVGLNRNAEIIYCNRTLLETTGWKAEEILGKDWFGLFVTDGAAVREAFRALLDDPDAERRFRHYENEILTRQGARLFIRWSNMLIQGPDGEVIGTMSMGEDITEHRKAEERFRALIEHAPAAIRIGRNVQTIYANPRFLEMFGFASLEEVLGTPLTDQYAPEMRDAIADRARRRELGMYASSTYETIGMRKDGARFPVHVATTRVVLEDGPATVGFFDDITERREAEEKLRSSEERFRGIFDQATVGVIATDLRGRLLTVNPAFTAISGYKDEMVFGREYASLTHPDDREREATLFGALQALERDSYSIEKRYVHAGGGTVWISESLAILRGSDGQPQGFTVVVEDITARRQAEDSLRALNAELEHRVAERTSDLKEANVKLEKLATEDGLTGLPNRRHLDQTIDRELSRGLRTADMLSFLMCDVDFFKRYNDRYGHAEGDACLKRVGAALRASFKRASDLPARYGGEEFSVIIPNTPPEHVLLLAEALRERLEKEAIPHEKSDVAPVVTISIGVVSAPITRDRDRAWYIKHADEALYRSKAEGRNRVTHVIV
ncbi:MAG: PAS domain S-box protein [Nitrospirota bacterium]